MMAWSLIPLLLVGGGQEAMNPGFVPPGSVETRAESPALSGRVVVIHRPEDGHRVERIVRVLDTHHRLPGLPPDVPSQARIYLAPDRGQFDALTGGRVPDWGAGVALPGLQRIVIPLFSVPWGDPWGEDRTLRHEWAHLGLHEYLSGLRIPRWFDEGYAQLAAGGTSIQEGWRLRVALAAGRAPSLDAISLEWPRERAAAELAYLLSATALEYMLAGSGVVGLTSFLERWRAEESFTTSLARTFGHTSASFEAGWRDYVRRRYGWLYVLSQSVVFWAILSVLVVFLFHRRRVRDRERLARLRAQEPPDDPAYWIWAQDRTTGDPAERDGA